MNTGEVISELKKRANFFEVYHKTNFECIRTDKNGRTQTVEVSIFDAGPDVNPQLRYHCVAKTEDGKMATGNPESSIDMLLLHVHWNNLD